MKTTLNQNRNVMYLFIACASALLPFGLSHAEGMNTGTYPSCFALVSVEIAEGTLSEKQAGEALQDVKKSRKELMATYYTELDVLLDEGILTKAEYKKLGGELEAIVFGTPLQSFMIQTKLGIISGEITEEDAEKQLIAFKKDSQNTFDAEIMKLKILLDDGSINKEEYQDLSSRLDVFTK